MKKASTARANPHPDYDDEEFFTPLLGADDDNVKTLGVIRPGIMVLKKSCEQADVERYDHLLARGMSWVDMAKEFGDKLIPQNVRLLHREQARLHKPRERRPHKGALRGP